MLRIYHEQNFLKKIKKIKDNLLKEKVKKQIQKIINNPEIGKPMKHSRKGTRELHVKPYRLSYSYLKKQEKIIMLNLYHKDKQ